MREPGKRQALVLFGGWVGQGEGALVHQEKKVVRDNLQQAASPRK
jgi:hypothetical protein